MNKNEGIFFEIEFEKRFCYNGERIGKIRTGRLEKQEEKIMKVLLVNGSPKAKGCTYTALQEAAAALEKQGIETEIFQVGGYIFGSPIHYASASGALTSFMDRAFYSGGSKMAGKPAAAVVSCRRGGATAGFDQINKYFTINNMPVVSSQYWNMVHGNTPDEVRQDEEGLQTMRTLGNNMAWLIKCIEAGKKAGITFPEREPAIKTNYIR